MNDIGTMISAIAVLVSALGLLYTVIRYRNVTSSRIVSKLTDHDARLESLEKHISEIKDSIDEMNRRLSEIDKRIGVLEAKIDPIWNAVARIATRKLAGNDNSKN